MPRFEHKNLIRRVQAVHTPPSSAGKHAHWIKGVDHLRLLRQNAREDQLLIDVASPHIFIHTVAVPTLDLQSVRDTDLLDWDGGLPSTRIGYVYSGAPQDSHVDVADGPWRPAALSRAHSLLYRRTTISNTGSGELQIEVHQEYAHVSEIPCVAPGGRFLLRDENGDLVDIVSATLNRESSTPSVVSFYRYPLEQYLAAANLTLVRLFDFNLYDPNTFAMWPRHDPPPIQKDDTLTFRRFEDPGYAGYVRGVQILPLSQSRAAIIASLDSGLLPRESGPPLSFLTHDWRHEQVVRVSLDPSATTNYAEKRPRLPYEMSPAFFRPEVLRKYESDSGKYVINGRTITCKDIWELQAIGRNEAGQVHAYLRYLRQLPYSEQMHWRGYNEAPKAQLSPDIIAMDFAGKWTDLKSQDAAVSAVTRKLHEWKKMSTPWWICRDESALADIRPMFTQSREEWSEKCRALASVLIEGFDLKWLRHTATECGMKPKPAEGSLMLLRRLVQETIPEAQGSELSGLRELQRARTVMSHTKGRRAHEFLQQIQRRDDGFRGHFDELCSRLKSELDLLSKALGGISDRGSDQGAGSASSLGISYSGVKARDGALQGTATS